MPIPVITVAQMREWEKATWASGGTEIEVISRVGEIVARRAAQMTADGDSILILAGKGHNGDDARQAEKHLPDRRVECLNISDPKKGLKDLAGSLEQEPALIIDGLFGIGLDRPLDEKWIQFIETVNASNVPILSVDVPSGLNAESGVADGAAIRAAVTLTLGAPKAGMLAATAWPSVGRLEVAADIGLAGEPAGGDLQWTLASDFEAFPPARPVAGHKGDFGRLTIIAGSLGYHGASVLTSRGAQRAQPGLITLHVPANIYGVVASQLQAVMVSQWSSIAKLPENPNAVLIGPGQAGEEFLPRDMKAAVTRIWRDWPCPVIVDASALHWLKPGAMKSSAIRLITPHPGEAAAMLETKSSEVQSDRPAALRELSRRFGNCWVALKGNETLVGRATGEIRVNSSGNPQLAQGGSGDVLSGFLAGLLAQPALQADPLKTVAYGVWAHGLAADRLAESRTNWVVEDLAGEIGWRAAGKGSG